MQSLHTNGRMSEGEGSSEQTDTKDANLEYTDYSCLPSGKLYRQLVAPVLLDNYLLRTFSSCSHIKWKLRTANIGPVWLVTVADSQSTRYLPKYIIKKNLDVRDNRVYIVYQIWHPYHPRRQRCEFKTRVARTSWLIKRLFDQGNEYYLQSKCHYCICNVQYLNSHDSQQ